MKRLLIIMLFCISFASCAVIQESRVVSKSSYDEVWHACVTSFSDIGYSIINTDKKSGIVVAERGSILNSQTVTKLNIILKESANGVSVNVIRRLLGNVIPTHLNRFTQTRCRSCIEHYGNSSNC